MIITPSNWFPHPLHRAQFLTLYPPSRSLCKDFCPKNPGNGTDPETPESKPPAKKPKFGSG